jgi:hypothetical protein
LLYNSPVGTIPRQPTEEHEGINGSYRQYEPVRQTVQFATVQFSSVQLTTRSPQLRTRRQLTGLCVMSYKVNICSSAKERPNKQSTNYCRITHPTRNSIFRHPHISFSVTSGIII